MSILKPGTLCVIIGGCPENIGLVVSVIIHLGRHLGREDAYLIETVSRRFFNQLKDGDELKRGMSTQAITDRHKLRPLVPSENHRALEIEVDMPKELVVQHDD